jgi:hypothetical protein
MASKAEVLARYLGGGTSTGGKSKSVTAENAIGSLYILQMGT